MPLDQKSSRILRQKWCYSFFCTPRLTNLLQPADVCWFSSIKKTYKEKWNHWYIYGEKSYVDLDHKLEDANDQINENDNLLFEANDCQQSYDDSVSDIDMEDTNSNQFMNADEQLLINSIETEISNIIPSNQLATVTSISRDLNFSKIQPEKIAPDTQPVPLQIIQLSTVPIESGSPSESAAPSASAVPRASAAPSKPKGRPKGSKNKPK